MRWVLVFVGLLVGGIGIALGAVFAAKSGLSAFSDPAPMTRDERAMFACETVIKEMIRTPRSFKRLDRGGTLKDDPGEVRGIPADMTSTVFEFTAENTYGTEIKSIGSCTFAWLIVDGVSGGNPIYVESSVNGKTPDEIATLSIGAKVATLKFPGDRH